MGERKRKEYIEEKVAVRDSGGGNPLCFFDCAKSLDPQKLKIIFNATYI